MTKSVVKKSGSGKVSSLNSIYESNPYFTYGYEGECYTSNLLRECIHSNNYWLCQQCEIRIRNQDVIDRIEYIFNEQFSNEIVDHTSYSINKHSAIDIKTNGMISHLTLRNLLQEFPEMFIHSNKELCTSEVYT